jgi:hypothetical protein
MTDQNEDFAILIFRRTMEQFCSLGWQPAELIREVLDFAGVNLDEDLIHKIAASKRMNPPGVTVLTSWQNDATLAAVARVRAEYAARTLTPEVQAVFESFFGREFLTKIWLREHEKR